MKVFASRASISFWYALGAVQAPGTRTMLGSVVDMIGHAGDRRKKKMQMLCEARNLKALSDLRCSSSQIDRLRMSGAFQRFGSEGSCFAYPLSGVIWPGHSIGYLI